MNFLDIFQKVKKFNGSFDLRSKALGITDENNFWYRIFDEHQYWRALVLAKEKKI